MQIVVHDGLKLTGTLPSGTGDNLLTTDSTSVGSVPAVDTSSFISTSLASGKIIVGNVSNIAAARTLSGDVLIDNTGITSIGTGVIVNADVSASAAIDASKLANGSVSNTEFQYLDGVTSAIQTQLDAKANLASPTFTGVVTVANLIDSGLTANTVPYANGSKQLVSSAVTPTELGYVSGVTSAIQTQLGTKLSATITSPATGDILYYNAGAWVNLARGTTGYVLTSTPSSIQWSAGTSNGVPSGGTAGQYLNKIDATNYNTQWSTLTLSKVTDVSSTAAEVNKLSGVTTTAAQFNYLNTATSDVQTQINAKLSNTLAQNALFVGNASNQASALAAGTNGYVLTSSAGVPTWVAPITSYLYRTINYSANSNFTAGSAIGTDYAYICQNTINATLPTAVGNAAIYYFKNTGVGVITINTTSAQTIDGNLTLLLNNTNEAVMLVSDNANWRILSSYFEGESISTVSTYTNYTTTATYQNITSITLPAGSWDLSAFFSYSSNGATITAASNAIFVISTTTASAAGATEGLNISYVPQAALLGTSKFSDCIAPYRVTPTSSTTYYLNSQATFTLGNPQYVGTIRAERVK